MPVNVALNTPDTYTVEDDGIRGNGVSVVRNSAGVVVQTIIHPADAVTFTIGSPGVHLIFNVADSFGTANVTVGSLTSSAQSPDSIVVRQIRTDNFLTMVSNGSITEGGMDAAADIVAAALVLSAVTGIGTPGNALETQTTFIEAETGTGGINIANFGVVQIGGVTASVDGLDVATSGDLNFSSTGSIFIADTSGPEMVHGGDSSGNVALTAIGFDSDIYTTIDGVTVRAAGGGVTLTAGRDVLAGVGGTNYNNDILATTFVTIEAGRDFQLDGTSNVRTGAFGGVVGGPILIQTGRNITLSNTTGGLQTIEAFLGNVTLTTGPGGTFRQNAAFSSAVQSSHDIFVNADIVLISSGGLNTTGTGSITIRPVTPGRPIDIGSTLDSAAALALSEAELDRLFTLNVNIGDANSGPVEFTAPISPNVFPTSLVVHSGTEILVRSSITLDGSLTLLAGNDLYFTPAGSFTTTSGGFTGVVDQSQDDGGAGGNGSLGGTITVTTTTILSGNVDNDTLNGGASANAIFGLGGNDTLRGLGGDDTLNGGTGSDRMIGGIGNDIYIVDNVGDVVTELPGEGIDEVRTALGSRSNPALVYTLPANVENLTGTSAGAQGVVGNALNNLIVMGNAGDLIVLHDGGDDTVIGGGGNDFIYYGAAFTSAGDSNDGGAGFDTVGLLGSYNITFGANDLVSIEKLALYSSGGGPPNNYTITMIDANVAAGASMLVVALSLQATETFVFNGAAETNGSFNVRGGRGNDTITAGAGNDQVFGNLGADNLRGGAGNDFFEYYATTHSTAAAMDQILDFTLGDKVNLFQIDADGNGANGNTAFAFIGSGAFTNTAGQVRAVQVSGNNWLVEADVNGDSIADLVIAVTVADLHPLTAGDFIL